MAWIWTIGVMLTNGVGAQEPTPPPAAEITAPAPPIAAAATDDGEPSPAAQTAPAAATPVERIGRRLRVKLPLVGSEDAIVKQSVQRIIDQLPEGPERPILVLEFRPLEGQEGQGSEFERCLSLARFLTGPSLERIKTVAYIPRGVVGHAVLPVLACEQIIMDPDAVLGDAGDGEQVIGATVRASYTEIARSRRTVPEAIALGILDGALQIDRVTTATGVLYVWPEELEKLKATRNDIRAIDTIVPAGQRARFRGDELRRLGFVSTLARNDQEVAAALHLSPDQFEYDPSSGGAWNAIRIDVSGPMTPQLVDRVVHAVEQQREQRRANLVMLQLESPGGSPTQSLRLANFLADLDPSQVRTVVFVPREARADAMLVAFAADQLVAHPDAVLGGGGAANIDPNEREDIRIALRSLSQRKGRAWSLYDAMINPDTVVFRYSNERGETRYWCEAEFDDQQAADPAGTKSWQRGEAITEAGATLQLDGRGADSFDMTKCLAESWPQVQQFYQLPTEPELIGPNWALEFIDALSSPRVSGLLLFIGSVALMVELSTPGVGIGGFVATCCYVLFFWSNLLHGTAELLEILMFLLGVACVALEIFVIPGFGIFGLGGGAMMLFSLVLASQTFVLPSNSYQWDEFSHSLTSVLMAGVGVLAALVLLRQNMHRAPFLRRIMLLPPTHEEREQLAVRERLADFERLLGQPGVTRTKLVPSGKALFGRELVDVITEGEMIDQGVTVQVIEAKGNRVVVRAFESTN